MATNVYAWMCNRDLAAVTSYRKGRQGRKQIRRNTFPLNPSAGNPRAHLLYTLVYSVIP